MGYKAASIFEAFARHLPYERTPDICWEWQSSLGSHGYGQLTFRRKVLTAHRLSHEIFKGPVEDGAFVCHSCDNRRCVNPHHLWVGSIQDNTADMWAKGRGTKGRRFPEREKVVCIRGHRYCDDNIIVRKGHRLCKECVKERDRQRHVRDREKRNAANKLRYASKKSTGI